METKVVQHGPYRNLVHVDQLLQDSHFMQIQPTNSYVCPITANPALMASGRRSKRANQSTFPSTTNASTLPRTTINDLPDEIWALISAEFASSLELEIKYKSSSFAPDLNHFCIISDDDRHGLMTPHPICYVSKRFCRSALPHIWESATFTFHPGIFNGFGFRDYRQIPSSLRQRIRRLLVYYSEISELATVGVPYLDEIDAQYDFRIMRMIEFPHLTHLTIMGAGHILTNNSIDRVNIAMEPDGILLSHYVHFKKTFEISLAINLKKKGSVACTAYYDEHHGLQMKYGFGVPPNQSWQFGMEDHLKLGRRNTVGLIQHLCNNGAIGARDLPFEWRERARARIAETQLASFDAAWIYHRSNQNQMGYYPLANG